MGTVLELHGFFVFLNHGFLILFIYKWLDVFRQENTRPPPPIFQNTAVYKQTLSTISLKDTFFL